MNVNGPKCGGYNADGITNSRRQPTWGGLPVLELDWGQVLDVILIF